MYEPLTTMNVLDSQARASHPRFSLVLSSPILSSTFIPFSFILTDTIHLLHIVISPFRINQSLLVSFPLFIDSIEKSQYSLSISTFIVPTTMAMGALERFSGGNDPEGWQYFTCLGFSEKYRLPLPYFCLDGEALHLVAS
ncbi:hypothetical protein HAX54_006658 [Datura stramonium]|uniref:Uncharacterized protein n=1 Tax=Datura stramonium TaxID=4076 RepID=A0ABS8TD10_DATST|nr:hypothetical protein [Datura stramonium]